MSEAEHRAPASTQEIAFQKMSLIIFTGKEKSRCAYCCSEYITEGNILLHYSYFTTLVTLHIIILLTKHTMSSENTMHCYRLNRPTIYKMVKMISTSTFYNSKLLTHTLMHQ